MGLLVTDFIDNEFALGTVNIYISITNVFILKNHNGFEARTEFQYRVKNGDVIADKAFKHQEMNKFYTKNEFSVLGSVHSDLYNTLKQNNFPDAVDV